MEIIQRNRRKSMLQQMWNIFFKTLMTVVLEIQKILQTNSIFFVSVAPNIKEHLLTPNFDKLIEFYDDKIPSHEKVENISWEHCYYQSSWL